MTDLRWTELLCSAPDIFTWANPGPGAARGLARVYGRPITGNRISRVPRAQMIAEMQDILAASRAVWCWPGLIDNEPALHVDDAWPAWEMRDVEHTLCEFQKYRKAQLGEGRPRGTYRHG